MDPNAAFDFPPDPPIVPGRFRAPLLHVIDDAMPATFLGPLSAWLHDHRAMFSRGGDVEGRDRFNYELVNPDEHCPALLAQFKKRLVELHVEALAPCKVPEFDLRFVEFHATLYHHGAHFTWHDDVPGYDGEVVPSRRLTFCYYMHAEPKMFRGGELEFLDGTAVEPKNNRLLFFHPAQQHRIRRVECWSGHFMHGRWALSGWLHGDPPAGWLDRLPALRGRPASG